MPPAPRLGLSLDELVVYELHVGTFSAEGTFDGVVPYLGGLRELGVTAIELMPVATFPGDRGWGYDGVYAYAPHPAYGGPEGLARLVDAAHGEGLGVILDVVYNHIGPGAEALTAFGPYLREHVQTFWGSGLDFSQAGVREWAIQNALCWVEDYGIDGLRLDAIGAIRDPSPRHVLEELAGRVHVTAPHALVIAETSVDDDAPARGLGPRRPLGGRAPPRAARALDRRARGLLRAVRLARRRRRTSSGAGRPSGTSSAPRTTTRSATAPSATGSRPPSSASPRRSSSSPPQTPLLFMGEEYGEPNPFQFFTDHISPEMARPTREGRKREFAAWSAFSGEDVPDPQERRRSCAPSSRGARLPAFATTTAGCSRCDVRSRARCTWRHADRG